jgi:recombinational DNA repair protein (RecF pathway)
MKANKKLEVLELRKRMEYLDAAEAIAMRISKVSGLMSSKTGVEVGQSIFALLSCLSAAEEAYPDIFALTVELYDELNEGAGLK